MNTFLKLLIIFIISFSGLNAQCDLKVNKDAFAGKKHKKHIETYSDLLCNSKEGVLYSGISNFYDGSPHFQIMVCLKGDHYSISKDHEVVFHIKDGQTIRKNNLLRTGAKKTKLGSGSYRCATYTIPIDDELRTLFMKDEKECALEKLEVTHKLGSSEFKIKKKYRNVLGQHVKCVFEALKE